MAVIENFDWYMQNVAGTQSVISLPALAKVVNAGFNEGNLKWRQLPRDAQVLAQSVTPIDTATGLLNPDCSAMQILVNTTDQQGDTIAGLVRAVKEFGAQLAGGRPVTFSTRRLGITGEREIERRILAFLPEEKLGDFFVLELDGNDSWIELPADLLKDVKNELTVEGGELRYSGHGQKLGKDVTFTWQTGDRDPTAQMAEGIAVLEANGKLAIPMGLIAAIYLTEYAGESRWLDLLRTCISTLAGVPSIVFGLFNCCS
jgi:hypothetical protein